MVLYRWELAVHSFAVALGLTPLSYFVLIRIYSMLSDCF